MRNVALEDRVVSSQLRCSAELFPDKPFFRFASAVFTYGEFEQRINRVANGLTELGLGKFGKVAIFARNSPGFLYGWFGTAKLGALYVPINTEYKGDVTHGIFSMIPILLKQPERSDDHEQPARAYYIGNQNPAFEERFKCRIIEVYGATETGIVTGFDYSAKRAPKSCGTANSETFDVAVLNERDEPVKPDEVGEICVRPRKPFSMIREYYGKPEATVEAFRNLWFHTGDNAKIDAEGNYTFVDRKKDAIRRRGENISSFELEFAVNKHPDVMECAAVAVPSDLGEDEVKMVVVLKDGADLSAEALWRFCEEALPRFWIPSFLEFRSELPKTANHKIQKYILRERSEAHRIFARDWKTGAIREM